MLVTVSAPRARLAWTFGGAALAAALLVVPVAHADLRPGTVHPLMAGAGKQARITMPVPVVSQVPTLRRTASGQIRVLTKVRYVAANWRATPGTSRDCVTVTLHVARRLLSTGPDPSGSRFRKPTVATLSRRQETRTYAVTLPLALSRYLEARGAFSSKPLLRTLARKLIWVDVQQDRDYQTVDGRYDWREGTAWNAADRNGAAVASGHHAFAGRAVAHTAGATHPSGTLTVQNGTSWGVFSNADQVYDQKTGYPVAPMGTVNNTGTPIVMAGSAVQCFASGSSGSNPQGFDNADAGGTGQPYAPGAVLGGASAKTAYAPASNGYAVTENITSDDSIAKASNNEVADVSGYIDGTLNLAFAAASVFLPTPSGFGGGANIGFLVTNILDVDTIPSPGTIVSALVDIALAVYDNSCGAYPNLMAIAAAEGGGSVVGDDLQVQENVFQPYGGSTDVPYGEQVEPSTNAYDGDPLYLHEFLDGFGVQPNGLAGSGDNYMAVGWLNYDYCDAMGYYGCSSTPAASPEVSSTTGPVDCGTGNTDCPYPAAGFPTGTGLPATVNTSPVTGTNVAGTTTSANGCGTLLASSGTQLAPGSAIFSPNGTYVLTMTSSGVLELYSTATSQMLWTAPPSNITSSSTLAFDGSLTVNAPLTGAQLWSSGGGSGNSLAVQNDGNVVIYNTTADTAPWSTGTQQGSTACQAYDVPVTLSGVAAAQAEGCAALSVPTTSDVQVIDGLGQYVLSPSQAVKLTIYGGSGSQQGELQMQNVAAGYTGLWWTETNGTSKHEMQTLYMETDGDLVGYNGDDDQIWDTGTGGNPGAFLAVQNDGNLVIYNQAFTTALWSSFGQGGGTLLPDPGCGLAPGTYTPPAS